MKKKFILFASLCLLTVSTLSASIVVPAPKPVNPPQMFDIGYGVKISTEQLLTLTPKEYRQLTGHHLGIFRSIGLNIFKKQMAKDQGNQKSQVAAAIICFFLGGLGIHRFYLGYTWQGIVQLLTAGGLGIWWLIDFVRICTGDLKPKNGEYKNKF